MESNRGARIVEAHSVVAAARDHLIEAEAELTEALVEEVQRDLEQLSTGVLRVLGLVESIPGRPSLDHNGVKRESTKALEDMSRNIQTIREKVGRLGEGL